MPIDFKQIAAPSFADSNTLVALAAKQQEAAMKGIQDTWTGAMDAVQNNVQGELKNRINMAGYDDLTDPVKRAALNADMLAFNEKNLGMADMNAMGAYVDGRIPITMANQTGKLAFNEATKAADRLDVQTLKDTKDAAQKSYLDDAVRQGSWLLDSIKQYGTPDTNPDFDPNYLAELNNRYSSLTDELNNHPDAESMLPKFYYGLEDFGNERTLANQKVNQGNLRTDGMSITNDNAVRGMNIRETDLAMRVGNHTGQDAKNTQATYSKVFADYPGLVNPDGVSLNFNAGRTLLNGEIAKVKDRSNDRLSDAGTFDEFLVTNKKSLDEMGNLGMFSNTSHESIMKHFEVAASKGVPYSDKEKMEAYRAIATGSIKVNMLPDFASGDAGELKVRKAMKNNFVRDSLSKRQDAINTGTREAINGVIDRYRAAGVPLDTLVGKDGLNLAANPELEQFLPSDIKEAMGIISKTNSDDYMNGPMGGIGGGMPRKDYAANNAPQVDIDVGKLVGNPNTNQQQYNGPLRNTNTATTTTEDLAAVGKANNVGKAPTTTNRPSNQKGNISNLVTKSGKTIPRDNVTPQMAKEANVKMVNGKLKWEDRFKGKTMETVYGEKIKINNVQDLERFIQVNYSGHVKEVQNVLANNGKSKYKYPADLSKIDKNHPLAHPDSDDPKNFVPYDQRNYDGSRKNKKPYKYSSYDTYVKLTLNKKLGRKNK